MLTAMREDESVDREGIRIQVDRMVQAGVDIIFCLGTNGEFYALSTDERFLVLETVLEAVDGRMPVIAGTGAVTTAESIRLSRDAHAAGADALAIITPYFAQASQSELAVHFRSIAEAVPLPVYLYNIPQRTGNTIEAGTVAILRETENIAGIKDSSGKADLLEHAHPLFALSVAQAATNELPP